MGAQPHMPPERCPQMKLSDRACKGFETMSKTYKKSDGQGLYLEVNKNGSKYWRMKYRIRGTEKRLSFGIYPEVSLSEARLKREEARKLIRDDIDPSEHKKAQKREKALNNLTTFESVAREWHELNLPKWTESHAGYIIRRLENDVFPVIGKRPINEIKPLEVLDTIRKIESRGAHEMASRALSVCGQVFRYAVITERAEIDITQSLKGALKPYKKGHYNALTSKELPEFLKALEHNDARLYPHTRHALELIILTFVRTSELINSKWDEIDLEKAEWHIPAERMKMGRPHFVPLSKQAIEVFKKLQDISYSRDFVFPSQVRSNKAMSNNTILKAIERLGYKGRATGHGFRATAMSTIKEELHYRHEVIDLQLAHVKKSKIDAAYDRAEFKEERTKMMQGWADYIDKALKQPVEESND